MMEYGLWEILLGIVALYLLVHYTTSGLDYWKKRGVPGPRPLPLFGNFGSVFLKQNGPPQVIYQIYNDYKSYPLVGAYRARQPIVVVNNLDLIKNILIKDFSAFAGRGLPVNEKSEPLTAHLFALDGPRWKELRKKLTPVFTTGKLKHMFDLIVECSDHFEKYLERQIGKESVLESKELFARFTTDVIGSCAFGLEMSAMDREDSEFRKMGQKIFTSSFKGVIIRLLREISPAFCKLFNLRLGSKEMDDFFISLIRDTMALRERENIVRHDFVDTLISIKNSNDTNQFKMDMGNLAAQAFVFFAAGFETSSTTAAFTLLELAHSPQHQDKLRKEILETLAACNGKITYDIVNEMKYLDMVVQETLRKNPPVQVLVRHAYQSYNVPDTNVTIDKGMQVFIPVYAIQHDPQYFPNPEKFDPERFTDEAKHLRHPMTHLPFGDGPKNCIGERFAYYQTKLGLIKIIKNYRVEPTKLSPLHYEIDISSVILSPKNGVNLKFKSI